jgi:DNA-binding IclR family transcriptional regulator
MMQEPKTLKSTDGRAERETGTVARVIMLLRAIADTENPPTMKMLADALNLPLSTMHRLLELLSAERMVERDDATKTFRPGSEYFRMASRVVHRMPLPMLARPFLDHASRDANESCYLGMLDAKAGKLVFVASSASNQMLDYRVPLNTPFSLVVGASGLSILAWLSPVTIDQITAAEKAQAEVTVPARKSLNQTLAQIREQGYGNTFGQRIKEAVGFFAPVFDGGGAVCASFGFTVPQSRFESRDGKRLAEIVMRHAGGLSSALGYVGAYPRSAQAYGDAS